MKKKKIIIPAINEAKKKQDLFLEGPVSADSAFSLKKRKNCDVVICMYHDQALIPIKTIDFFNGVNVTLGLDFIFNLTINFNIPWFCFKILRFLNRI